MIMGGWGQQLQSGSVSFRGVLGSGPRFCGLGARPCTGGLGAGPQHLPLMCPQPPETQNKKLAGSSFWVLASCPLILISDFSHGRTDGPSSLPAPWTLLIPLASRYKGVSTPAPLPMTDRRLQINIPISSPPGGGGPFGGRDWNASHKVQVESTLLPTASTSMTCFSSFPVPLSLVLTLLPGTTSKIKSQTYTQA